MPAAGTLAPAEEVKEPLRMSVKLFANINTDVPWLTAG